MKAGGRSHNHAPKLSDSVQAVLTELKRRILTNNGQSIGKNLRRRSKEICKFLILSLNM